METQILQFLQQTPEVMYSAKEVGKKLDRKQYKENPNWARPFLDLLLGKRLIEADNNDHYFFPKKKKLGQIV